MSNNYFLKQKTVFDVLLITSITTSIVLGPLSGIGVILFSIIPLFTLFLSKNGRAVFLHTLTTVKPTQWLVNFLILQYFLYMSILAFVNPVPITVSDAEAYAYPGFWLILCLITLLLCFRFTIVTINASMITSLLFGGVWFSFAVLSLDKLPGVINSYHTCRVSAFYHSPFTPAVFFWAFTLLLFLQWPNFAKRQKAHLMVLVCLAVVVSNAYTGVRFSAITQSLNFAMMFVILFIYEKERKYLLLLILAVLAGGIATIAIDAITGCGYIDRLTAVSRMLKEDKNISDVSLKSRVGMLSLAIQSAVDNFWTGAGIWSAKELLNAAGFVEFNVHNQYLSWIIWGGVTTLISGLLFLFAPLILIVGSKNPIKKSMLLVMFVFHIPVMLASLDLMKNEPYIIAHVLLVLMATRLFDEAPQPLPDTSSNEITPNTN